MLTDARDLAAGAQLDADVCIVGSGPAGLTLARELIGSGLSTIVVESGGLEADADTQSLADGETTGHPFCALGGTRARRFGGTSALWDSRWDPDNVGFRGGPLDPVDFEDRDWVPNSGWPFDRHHMDPYYRRAHDTGGMGEYQYDPARWASADAQELALEGDSLETSIWLFGAQKTFAHGLRTEIERAADVTVLLNANVVELETNDDALRVTAVRAICLPGKPLGVRADVVVLAAGGIENARLLLLSDRAHRGGLGNEHDVVGRYFMEHQQVRAGFLTPEKRELLDTMALYDERHVDGASVMGQLHLTDTVMRRERLLNAVAAFLPVHRHWLRFRWKSADTLSALVRDLMRGRVSQDPVAAFAEVFRGRDFVAARALRSLSGKRLFRYWGEAAPSLVRGFGWSSLPDKQKRFGMLDVIMHLEQAPDPDNRVTLSDRRDRLGCRTANLHWEWRAIDSESAARVQLLLQREMARSRIGRLDTRPNEAWPYLIASGLHHHMGTTRMHRNPKRGVVDEHCRVHGVANLFIAGCSVFPSGGYINPTLTIMALAVRLADRVRHIASQGASGREEGINR